MPTYTVQLTDGSTDRVVARDGRQAKLLVTVARVGHAMRTNSTLDIPRPTSATLTSSTRDSAVEPTVEPNL